MIQSEWHVNRERIEAYSLSHANPLIVITISRDRIKWRKALERVHAILMVFCLSTYTERQLDVIYNAYVRVYLYVVRIILTR